MSPRVAARSSRTRLRSGAISTLAVALVALALCAVLPSSARAGAAGVAVKPHRHHPLIAVHIDPTQRTVTIDPLDWSERVDREPAAVPTPPRRLFVLGASYTQGVGASPATEGFAYLLARKTGMETTVDGVGGTGFLNPGGNPATSQDYLSRLKARELPQPPDVVLIQCGRNDISYPRPAEDAAVGAAIGDVRAKWPAASIVMLGPLPWSAPADPSVIEMNDFMRAAAAARQVAYIDGIADGWISAQNAGSFASDVPQHPNNAGHEMIASQVAAFILSLRTR